MDGDRSLDPCDPLDAQTLPFFERSPLAKSVGGAALLRDNGVVAGSDGKATLNSTIVATRHQVSTDLAGEKVLLDTRRGRYYALSGVGTTIWQLIGEPMQVQDICDRIVDAYEVEPEQCHNDVLEWVDALVGAGLIEIAPGPGSEASSRGSTSEMAPSDGRTP